MSKILCLISIASFGYAQGGAPGNHAIGSLCFIGFLGSPPQSRVIGWVGLTFKYYSVIIKPVKAVVN
jgi:hypothetical protein